MDIHTAAARVALIALRAQVDQLDRSPDTLVGYSISGSEEILSPEIVLERLARLPKPMRCSAEGVERVLKIVCEPIIDSLLRQRRISEADEATQFWSKAIEQIWGKQLEAPTTLLRGATDSAIVPFEALTLFVRDYDIAYLFASAGSSPADLPSGVHLALEARTPPKASVKVNWRGRPFR